MKKQNDKFRVSKAEFGQKKKGIIEDDYIMMEECGSGAFATVCKVKKKISNQTCALKIIKKPKMKIQQKCI